MFAKDYRRLSEKALISACQRGEQQAFQVIFQRYRRYVLALLGRYSTYPDRYDLLQDCFMRIFRGIVHFRKGAALATWIHRIVLNVARSYLRLRHYHQLTQSFDEQVCQANAMIQQNSPEFEYCYNKQQHALKYCMDQMPLKFKEILSLRLQQNLDYAEIAAVLNCPIGTVRSRLARARDYMMRYFCW